MPALDDAYTRLRRIAGKLMTGERVGHTLSPTDVVHEAMARLLTGGWEPREGDNVVDLVRNASRAMTEVLIDYSRRRSAAKRGGGNRRIKLEDMDDLEATIDRSSFDWKALDDAMNELQQIDSRRHTVVLLRFFGGLDNRQIAQELDIDERTVGRDWTAARLWLQNRLKHQLEGDGDERN